MVPRVWISQFTGSDGTAVDLTGHDVVVFVGPNNAGKSAALRGLRGKLEEPGTLSPVIASIAFSKEGSPEELESWLREWTHIQENERDPRFEVFGVGVPRS